MLIDFSGIPQYDRERQAWSNILSNIENIEDQELKENLFDSIKDWSQQFVILHREIDNEVGFVSGKRSEGGYGSPCYNVFIRRAVEQSGSSLPSWGRGRGFESHPRYFLHSRALRWGQRATVGIKRKMRYTPRILIFVAMIFNIML
jgi:hypothetical protein